METNKTITALKGSSEYKYLDDYIKALEAYHEQDLLTPDEVARLDEFRMIKRQLEILEILKTKIIEMRIEGGFDVGEIETGDR
jgi:hypothetical protein